PPRIRVPAIPSVIARFNKASKPVAPSSDQSLSGLSMLLRTHDCTRDNNDPHAAEVRSDTMLSRFPSECPAEGGAGPGGGKAEHDQSADRLAFPMPQWRQKLHFAIKPIARLTVGSGWKNAVPASSPNPFTPLINPK